MCIRPPEIAHSRTLAYTLQDIRSQNTPMLYFAYGSNMLQTRLRARLNLAEPQTTAVLPGHRLRFHKHGGDGSAKCDIHATGRLEDRVHGVVYRIDPEEKAVLDAIEGVGYGYEVKTVGLECETGSLEAFAYYATHIDAGLKPFCWYKALVLAGAREHGLPPEYIAAIEAVEVLADSDSRRRLVHEQLLAGLD